MFVYKEKPKGMEEMCKIMKELRDESYTKGESETETLYLTSISGMIASIIEGGEADISECIDEDNVIW
jgi:hypothetical protein